MMIPVKPIDWVKPNIGEIADVVAGGTPKAGNPENFKEPGTGIAWLTPADLSGYSEKYIRFGARDLSQVGYESSSAKLLPKGSLLFSSRAPIGYVAIAQKEIATNQGFKNFVFPFGVNSDYAYYYLRSIKDIAESLGTGTTFKEISGATAKTLPFVLPPQAEQKVIADKLDTLLAQVETTKARLERIPEILKSFRQSVLAAAVSGKLTEEWRTKYTYKISIQNILDFKHSLIERGIVKSSKQDIPLPFDEELSVIPDSWAWSRLITVCSLITDGKHGNCKDELNSGFYFLSAKDVSNKKLVYENARQINQIEFKEVHQRTNLEPGDICIVNTGATVGKYAIAGDNEHTRNTTFQKSVAVVKVLKEYANNKFVAYYFEDATLRLLKASSGSAVNNLLLGTMKQLPIPLPPIEEQTEIVRRVEELFAFADSIEQKAAAALARVNNLTQSILAKAFRGELTADWRAANPALISGENSAEALLAKIQSERTKKTVQRKSLRA